MVFCLLKSGMAACTCQLSQCCRNIDNWISGACWPFNIVYMVSPRPMRDPLSKAQTESTRGMRLFSGCCKYVQIFSLTLQTHASALTWMCMTKQNYAPVVFHPCASFELCMGKHDHLHTPGSGRACNLHVGLVYLLISNNFQCQWRSPLTRNLAV